MDAAFVVEWLNLVLRWAHMIVGIAWIGASFYFIWLDNHLHPPLDPADAAKGIGGEVWAVHGGGFYTAKKFTLAPEKLPPELHWFKWEAYTTLITGFFLLCLVYYYGAEVALIDPAVMPLAKPEAIAIGLGFLVLGWLVYDGLCRSAFGEDDAILGGLLVLYCAVAAWALCHLFSGRGAYIHFGAMLGTIMVLNVYFVIIPGQRELVKAKEEGRTPDPKYGADGPPALGPQHLFHPARAVHHDQQPLCRPLRPRVELGPADADLGGGRAGPRLVRAAPQGQARTRWCWPPGLVDAGDHRARVAAAARPPISARRPRFAEVQPIFQARCQSCHATKPTQEGFAAPPKGVILETPGGDPRPRRDDQPAGLGHPGHAARQPDQHHRGRAAPDCALVQGRRTIAA